MGKGSELDSMLELTDIIKGQAGIIQNLLNNQSKLADAVIALKDRINKLEKENIGV